MGYSRNNSTSAQNLILTMVSAKAGSGTSKKYCYICKEVITVNNRIQSLKDHHDEEHSEAIANAKKSNNMEDCVRSCCKICGTQVKVTGMRGHTKNSHGMVITDYKMKYNQTYYDLVELVLHQCGICEEYLLLDSDYIAQHLKGGGGFHDITHGNYNAKYMKMVNSTAFGKKTSSDSESQLSKKKTTRKEKTAKKTSEKIQKFSSLNFEMPITTKDLHEEKTIDKEQSKFDAAVNALNDEIDNTLKSFSESCENEADEEVERITVESFRLLLDSLSIDGEEIRFPALESLLNRDI